MSLECPLCVEWMRRSGQKQIEVPILANCRKPVRNRREKDRGMGDIKGLVVGPELSLIGFEGQGALQDGLRFEPD